MEHSIKIVIISSIKIEIIFNFNFKFLVQLEDYSDYYSEDLTLLSFSLFPSYFFYSTLEDISLSLSLHLKMI